MKESEKRRSDRLLLTIPLRVEAEAAAGQAFECEGRTTTVSRFGARIRVSRPLVARQKVRLTNLINRKSGQFTVVGLVRAEPDGSGEWGVTATDSASDIWGILFPTPTSEPRQPKALLECAQCGSIAVVHLTQPEVEALEEAVRLAKPCAQCKKDTSWGYPIKTVGMMAATTESNPNALDPAVVALTSADLIQRAPRFPLQRPVTVNSEAGGSERVLSENISASGLCFTSERDYSVDESVSINWPHGGDGRRIEVRGKIIRSDDRGGERRLFGVQYDTSPTLMQKPTGLSVGWVYAGYGATIPFAAAAIAWGVAALMSSIYSPFVGLRPLWKSVVGLLAVLLALSLWKRIVKREPEDERRIRIKHQVVLGLTGAAVLAAMAGGIYYGLSTGRVEQRLRFLNRDSTIEGILEQRLDGTATERFSSPAGFVSAWGQMTPLHDEWKASLRRVSTDVAGLQGQLSGLKAWKFRIFTRIVDLERRKDALWDEQMALAHQMASVSPADQQAFWTSKVLPLRDLEMHYQARKRELINDLTAR